MHAYLIVRNSNQDAQELIDQIAAKTKIINFPISKIDDIRELSSLTKIKQQHPTTIVSDNFGDASEEAQNAFLKHLEEPQENIKYILTTSSDTKVLPTIKSRCEIHEITTDSEKQNTEKAAKFVESSVGEQMQFISKIKKREDAENFINELLSYVHQNKPENMRVLAHHALEALNSIKRYGNIQLQLTRLVVNLTEP